MTKEEQVERIYLEIADKKLSLGCNMIIYNPTGDAKYIEESDVWNGFMILSATNGYSLLYHKDDLKEYKTIGHPVMIGDVMDYWKCNNIDEIAIEKLGRWKTYTPFYEMIRLLWLKPRLPIEQQDKEAIEFVYNLLSKD